MTIAQNFQDHHRLQQSPKCCNVSKRKATAYSLAQKWRETIHENGGMENQLRRHGSCDGDTSPNGVAPKNHGGTSSVQNQKIWGFLEEKCVKCLRLPTASSPPGTYYYCGTSAIGLRLFIQNDLLFTLLLDLAILTFWGKDHAGGRVRFDHDGIAGILGTPIYRIH